MLDKLALNNQILKRKKLVQKAKIQIVNKLVQKIRKLKTSLQKQETNDKIQNKLKIQLEILSYVKKCNNFEVLKNAILNEENPCRILTNNETSSQLKAFALFYQHSVVSKAVKEVKDELGLNGEDSKWKKEVKNLGKLKAKRKISRELKSKSNQWEIQDAGESKKGEIKHLSGSTITAESNTENKEPKPKENPNPRKSTTIIQENTESHHKQEDTVSKAVDPFFITNEGENYLANIVKSSQMEVSYVSTQESGQNRKFAKKTHTKLRPATNKFNNFKPKVKLDRKNKFKEVKLKKTEKQNNNRNEKYVHPKSQPDTASTEGLHPSWIAKQKLKPVISEFKGQKIVFDDN